MKRALLFTTLLCATLLLALVRPAAAQGVSYTVSCGPAGGGTTVAHYTDPYTGAGGSYVGNYYHDQNNWCTTVQRTWVEGRWVMNAWNQKVYIPPHWENRTVWVPCNTAPVPAPAPTPAWQNPGGWNTPGAPMPHNICLQPSMPPVTFNNALNSIASQSFESGRVAVARQLISSNCMSSEQVRSILTLMQFESSRLDLAKYAYRFTCDPQNYHVVYSVFQFGSSVQDLANFLAMQ